MNKKWLVSLALSSFIFMAGVISITVYVDPFFVYHAPLEEMSYQYLNEAYQVPGIARNFQYDQIITGSSMTENFSTDLLTSLFNADNTVKLCYSGASLRNEAEILQTALATENQKIKRVFMSLDLWTFTNDYKEISNQSPEFLMDGTMINDAGYLLNKDVLLENIIPVLQRSVKGTPSQDMDSAFRWYGLAYGDYAILNQWSPPSYEGIPEQNPFDQYMSDAIDNVEYNLRPIIEKYPEVDFYMFFPPYSILYWYEQSPDLEAILKVREYVSNELMEYDNVFLYDFQSESRMILNLWNYKDTQHYNPKINDFIANCFASGEYKVSAPDDIQKNNSDIRNILSKWRLKDIRQDYLWSKKEIIDYTDVFFEDDYKIYIVVKTDSSWNWSEDMVNCWKKLGSRYNLNENHDSSYYAVIEHGQIQTEALDTKPLVYEENNIRLTSSASWNDDACIQINGVEYSQNSRGLNIVVYDKKQGKVVDSVAFDTCGDGAAERMNRWQ